MRKEGSSYNYKDKREMWKQRTKLHSLFLIIKESMFLLDIKLDTVCSTKY